MCGPSSLGTETEKPSMSKQTSQPCVRAAWSIWENTVADGAPTRARNAFSLVLCSSGACWEPVPGGRELVQDVVGVDLLSGHSVVSELHAGDMDAAESLIQERDEAPRRVGDAVCDPQHLGDDRRRGSVLLGPRRWPHRHRRETRASPGHGGRGRGTGPPARRRPGGPQQDAFAAVSSSCASTSRGILVSALR